MFKIWNPKTMPINVLHEFPEHTLYLGREIPGARSTVLMTMLVSLPAERNFCTQSRLTTFFRIFFQVHLLQESCKLSLCNRLYLAAVA